MEKKRLDERKEPEIVYSRSVKAGRRIYYLDVKKARNEDLYVCITESKKKSSGESESPSFEKHKLFLYKEDFAHFVEGLDDVIGFVKQQVGEIEERQKWTPEPGTVEETVSPESVAPAEEESPVVAEESVAPAEEPKRRGFFARLRN